MKAIIMAGGKGQRLRPLTDTLPKPLLPVGGVPAIVRILSLLRLHGITEAAVTTGYLATTLENAIGKTAEGVEITYFREETPLGTAGSVKAARSFLDGEDFLVISGDAVSECDLSKAIKRRQELDATALLLLSRVSDPGEYGVVLCDENGKITGFSEKPSLSSTYTDTVNTGIYLFAERIFDFIPDGVYDFGRDLFPALLRSGESLYGSVDDGYWCDIGDPRSYLLANMRYTNRENAIGKNCDIQTDDIRTSVIFDGCRIGKGTRIKNAILCRNVTVGCDCVIGEGVILGEDSFVGDSAVIADDTHLPGGSHIPEGSFLRSAGGLRYDKLRSFLSEQGISCKNEEMPPSLAMRVGYALATACGRGRIGLMHDDSVESGRVGAALLRGFRTAGAEVILLGQGFEASAAYAATVMALDLSLFLRSEGGKLFLSFFDNNGLYPKRDFERRFLSLLHEEPSEEQEPPRRTSTCQFTEETYLSMLSEYRCALGSLSVSVTRSNAASQLLERAFLTLGAKVGKQGLRLSVSDDGFTLTAEQNGFVLDDWHIKALLLRYLIRDRVALPNTAPAILLGLCRGHCDLYTHCPSGDGEDAVRTKAKEHPELRHACVAAIALAALVAASHRELRELSSHLPSFAVVGRELLTDNGRRLTILSLLGTPAGDGILASYTRGSVRIIPSRRGFRLLSEAVSGEYAEELLSLSEKEIKRLLKEKP